jgi:hypothetical protein
VSAHCREFGYIRERLSMPPPAAGGAALQALDLVAVA